MWWLKESHISGIIQYLSFCVWFLWLSKMSLRFIHIVACVRMSFLRLNNILLYGLTFCLSIHWFMAIWVVTAFWLLWIMLCEHVCARTCSRPSFQFFGYIPRTGVAGLYGNFMCNFLRSHQTVFHSGCTTLHSRQQCLRVPISPHPH